MDRTLVLIVLIVAVVANIAIIGLAILTVRRRGVGRPDAGPPPGGILVAMPPVSVTRLPAADHVPSLAGATAPSVVTSATMTIPSPSSTTVAAMTDRSPDASIPTTSGRWSLPPHEDPRAEETIHALVTGTASSPSEATDDALVDPVTGFAGRRAWEEIFRNEDERLARYGRPVTVLVAELDGLDALAARLGELPADRLIPPVAAALRKNARAADILARVGHARFVGLLPETDEIAAINYVERVRAACDMWLAAGAVAVRLAIGWAQAPAGGRLDAALRLADDRMNGDRRRQARAATSEAPEGAQAPAAGPAPASAVEPVPAATVVPPAAAPAPEPVAAEPARSPAEPAVAARVPATGYVPDGPYPGLDGELPSPIPVVDAEKTFY